MKVSFIIPLYNEERRIEKTIREITAFRSRLPYENEWIFVDDGSRDATEPLTRSLLGAMTYRWIKLEKNQGKGRAVQKGMLAAGGDYLFFVDADLSTPLPEFEKLLRALKEGYEVAIGSRGLPESRVLIHQSWIRETMGKMFNRIGRLLAFGPIGDSQCGFKGFRREAARKLFPLQKISRFSFDAEIIYLAQRLHFRIREVPVTWVNSRESRVRIIQDSLQMLIDLLRIRWLHRNLGAG